MDFQNTTIFKKNWKIGLKDNDWIILVEPFATEFKEDYAYYVHFKEWRDTNYHMWYADLNNWVVFTDAFANFIYKNFAHKVRTGYVSLYNRFTWELIEEHFADRVTPATMSQVHGSPLVNWAYQLSAYDKNWATPVLLRFTKDWRIGLCTDDGEIVVKPFATEISSDGRYCSANTGMYGVIDMITGKDIYLPGADYIHLNKNSDWYIFEVKDNEGVPVYTNWDIPDDYLYFVQNIIKFH